MHTLAIPTLPPLRKLPTRQLVLVALAIVLLAGSASAGVTGDEFKDLYDDAKAWTEGYLGRAIAFLSFLLGAGWSAARQNMMPVIFGLILAMLIGVGPALIDKLLSALV